MKVYMLNCLSEHVEIDWKNVAGLALNYGLIIKVIRKRKGEKWKKGNVENMFNYKMEDALTKKHEKTAII